MKTNILTRGIELAKMAGAAYKIEKTEEKSISDNARIHLAERMGKLRGLPQKMGQILSMSSIEDEADTFKPLRDSAQALPLAAVIHELIKAWDQPIETIVKEIDPVGHAASLGQVHRAILNDGSVVAIKVRYPGIREAVMSDLKLLGWISLPVGGLKQKGFDLSAYQKEIMKDLEIELDYLKEMENQKIYAKSAKDLDFLCIPDVYTDLCRENVLVTSWEDGESIDDVIQNWDDDEKRQTGFNILRHFTEMLFCHGHVHADPHPGNYRFRLVNGEPEIVLYDFGCVYQSKAKREVILLKIMQACIDPGKDDPFALYRAMGFNEEFLEPIRDKLPALSQVIFEPFLVE